MNSNKDEELTMVILEELKNEDQIKVRLNGKSSSHSKRHVVLQKQN